MHPFVRGDKYERTELTSLYEDRSEKTHDTDQNSHRSILWPLAFVLIFQIWQQ